MAKNVPVGREAFNPRRLVVIGATFGSFLVLESMGAPDIAKLLAVITGALFFLNTNYHTVVASIGQRITDFAS